MKDNNANLEIFNIVKEDTNGNIINNHTVNAEKIMSETDILLLNNKDLLYAIWDKCYDAIIIKDRLTFNTKTSFTIKGAVNDV